MSSESFLDDVVVEVTKDDLDRLSDMCSLLTTALESIESTERALAVLKEAEHKLSMEDIPNLMLSKGITTITLESGTSVSIKESITCAVPKDPIKRHAVLTWLSDNGGDSIIDDTLTIQEPTIDTEKTLMAYNIPYLHNKTVHHARFKSFVSAKLGLKKGSIAEIEASDVPKEANLYYYKKAAVKE